METVKIHMGDESSDTRVNIRDSVILEVATASLDKIEGIHSLSPHFIDGLSNKFMGSRLPGMNVKHRKEGLIEINIYLNVWYGYHLYEMAQNIQRVIKEDMAMILGIAPVKVDVHIQHMYIPEEDSVVDEIESTSEA